MRSLIVFSLLTLFALGTVLSAQDDGLDEFFFSSESTWTFDLDEFWERVQDQRYRHVATLASDSSGGETLLSIDVAFPLAPGQLLLIEDRDHPTRVRGVEGDVGGPGVVVLVEHLFPGLPAVGRAVDAALGVGAEGPPQHRGKGLQSNANNIVIRLLCRQSRTSGLSMEAKHH